MPRLTATHVGDLPDGTRIYRPIILVDIEVGPLGIRVPALLDSGADNTLVPAAFITPLGVDFASLPMGPGGVGPGGRVDVRPCSGAMKWDGATIMTAFMVAEPGKGADTVLLGRADFFARFVVRFNWHRDPPTFDVDPVSRK